MYIVAILIYVHFHVQFSTSNCSEVDVRRQTMLILDLVSNTQDAIQQSFLAYHKFCTVHTWKLTAGI